MVTPRDRVWTTVIALLEERRGISTRDVRTVAKDTFDDPPSRGTINSTLNAMAELGVLERLGGKGQAAHYVER